MASVTYRRELGTRPRYHAAHRRPRRQALATTVCRAKLAPWTTSQPATTTPCRSRTPTGRASAGTPIAQFRTGSRNSCSRPDSPRRVRRRRRTAHHPVLLPLRGRPHLRPRIRRQRHVAQPPGWPSVAVSIAMLDGLVASKTAADHSGNYRSVVVFGDATGSPIRPGSAAFWRPPPSATFRTGTPAGLRAGQRRRIDTHGARRHRDRRGPGEDSIRRADGPDRRRPRRARLGFVRTL